MKESVTKKIPISDIAIIGYSFKFPEAISKEELWDILSLKKSAISNTPKERWDWPEWVDTETTHKGINKGGYIKDVDKFDASFFKISPREAELMDPQQRILIELTWELLENSCYKASSIKESKTGVYIGASGSDYELLIRAQKDEGIHKGSGTSTLGAILPNRISYFFDFEGPSMLIDTACSSSLVAINEAVNAIRSGECEQAIAGGINVKCHPGRSLAYFQSKMLSENGKCQTFDEKANGFVRGEGAAVLFLKPLKQAITDGDKIHAVIKETSVNHGGQSAGLTVPDSHKQAKLIEDAYRKSNLDINSISYIEAHGTGTGLGDPIEVAGLTMAFNNLKTKNEEFKKPWCGLGSIKTNIGHLEAASGMAGVMKIILSMENAALPATRNFEKLNPKLSLKNSPFYIHDKMVPWKPRHGYNEVRAGVSSFGLGGANGHVVLESFTQRAKKETVKTNKESTYLFILSAKSKIRLDEYAKKWVHFLDSNLIDDFSSMSYVLTRGREEFEDRLAIVFSDLDNLKTNLISFLNKESNESLFKGNIRAASNSIDFLKAQPELVNDWMLDRDLLQLGKYWCYGLSLDWSLLFENKNIDKLSLPTYPFARDKHWIELKKPINVEKNRLHPLLHENISDLNEQKFSTTFTGKEIFLMDHVVGKEKVLPGVAQIEMIREAGERSTLSKVTRISHLNWIRPIRVGDQPINVLLNLVPSNDEGVDFKIYNKEGEQENIYSQGKLSTSPQETDLNYDLNNLLERLPITQDKEKCYSLLKDKNLNLGQSYKGIQKVHYNDKEILSEIELDKEDGFVFTPGILDSCLQSCLLWFLFREDKGLALPYSVKEITIYKTLSKKLWCYARKSALNQKENQIQKYDIDILNEEGEVLISMRDFLFFPLNGLAQSNPKENVARIAHLYTGIWEKSDKLSTSNNDSSHTTVYLIGAKKSMASALRKKLEINVITPSETNLEEYFLSVFQGVRQSIVDNVASNVIIVCDNEDYHQYGFLSGLLKTAHLENNKITGKVIGIYSLNSMKTDSFIKLVEKELFSLENEVRYIDNVRSVKTYQTTEVSKENTPVIKEGGVYLLTGGSGGLGLIFADYISKTNDTTIILVGRSKLNDLKKQLIEKIPRVTYHQADINNKREVERLIVKIKSEHGAINGVIHSAGVIRDSFILHKTEDQIREVLAPKLQGVINLDDATSEEKLDFMVLFSSVAAVFGNIGQSDYASANAFLDNFAEYRERLKKSGKRNGNTVSINWSLWQDGGMQIDSSSKKYLEKKWHMHTLPSEEGIKAFEQLVNSQVTQGVIVCGEKQKIYHALIASTGKQIQESILQTPAKTQISSPIPFRDNLTEQIREFTSLLLKLEINKIQNDVEWGEFGFDSVMLTEFSNKLNIHYGLDLNPTVFYNYPTINDLSEHLEIEYNDQLKEMQIESTIEMKGIVQSAPQTLNSTVASESDLREGTAKKICEFASELLKLETSKIKGDIEWGEYGFDSVMLTEFSNKLNSYYILDLNPTIFYNYPTMDNLVENLLEEYKDVLEKKHSKLNQSISVVHSPKVQTPTSNKAVKSMRISTESLSKVSEVEEYSSESIAIIGVDGRFPQSPDLDTFWENLRDKKDLITEIPSDRWDWKKYYGDPLKETNKTKAKWGGFIQDIDKFDPLFFSISPREAELMDPQQRITLESVYSALDDAGIANDKIKGTNTGVFIGVASSDYSVLLNSNPLSTEAEFSTGEAHSVLANRISYLLDIHGPSEPIDTACSSSLIAIHRAVENIRNGSCKMAIAGGVNAIITPQRTLSFSQAGMLSEDGRCKTFDQNANGYVRGEGVGVVILKNLKQAVAEGDQIYGIIRGTSENHGGKANTLTSPNPKAQKELLVRAYEKAKIDPRDISYIEAHGTGTPLGDPIEIEGLKSAFSSLYKKHQLSKPEIPYCGIGSVKTNIGHLEAAAGMAGVLKVICALKHQTLPGNPNLKQQNEYLNLDKTPFYLLKDTIPWKTTDDKPRIAGVSSFGFGGANAHVIIEEYKENKLVAFTSNDPAIIVLSAKNKERLKDQVANLFEHISENPTENLYDIAYTLQEGRSAMEERLAFLAKSTDEALEILSKYQDGKEEAIFSGNTKEGKSDFLLEGGAGEAYIDYAIKNKESKSLIQLWTKGVIIDWNLLYNNNKPNKISLPTYPFARDRHWVPDQPNFQSEGKTISKLHPLLHKNESNFEEQRFTSIFNGNEFFFADHKVGQTKVLPGVAYLELVREAAIHSTRKEINQFNNITWMSPVSLLKDEKKININLFENKGNFDFEIHSDTEGEDVIHSKGEVRAVEFNSLEAIDISKIKARCTDNILGTQFYNQVIDVGVSLGNSFRGIQELFFNDAEAISRIELDPNGRFVLPPGILDSAIQTYVGVDMSDPNRVTGLPYRIKEVNIYKSLEGISSCWAYARKRITETKDGTPHFDIDLVDNEGMILVSFIDLIIVSIKRNVYETRKEKTQTLTLYSSKWITSSNITEEYV